MLISRAKFVQLVLPLPSRYFHTGYVAASHDVYLLRRFPTWPCSIWATGGVQKASSSLGNIQNGSARQIERRPGPRTHVAPSVNLTGTRSFQG